MVQLASDAVIDAVLFDYRGTLFGDEDDLNWIRNAAAGIGRSLADEEIVAIIDRLAETEAFPQIQAALERSDTSLDVHREANLTWFAAAGIDDDLAFAIWARDGDPDATFAFPDSAPVMRTLHEAGTRMAVVSNIHYDIRDHFRRHDLDRYVDGYVLSFEHGCQKPDAEMFIRALDVLDITAERALMVGDTPLLDGAAAHVGIQTLILAGPFRSGHRDSRGLDAVLRLVGIA